VVKLHRTPKVKCYLAASVALLTLLVYLPTLRNDFVELDDAAYILDNPYIRSFNQELFRWAFLQFYAANWHPLTWLSHALDYALWGLNPLGHHLTNIVLHAVNSSLVVVLASKLLEITQKRSAPKSPASFLTDRTILIAAGVTGLLFGIHPVHVESVAWVAERKDLLCALFFLASIIMYATHAASMSSEAYGTESGGAAQGILRYKHVANRRYLASLGLFVLALLSKPMAVTLPAVLLLLDWFPFGLVRDFRTFRAALVEKFPFISLSLASSVLTILAQKSGEALVSTQLLPWPYLAKMILPSDLAAYYPYPVLREISLYRVEYLIPVVLIIVITATFIIMVKRQKIWFAAWCYYTITLLPVLGIVQVGGQAMADRYTYLPSLGPFLLAGLGAAWVHARTKATGNPQLANTIGVSAAALFFLILSIITVRQIGIWKNGIVVFDAILEKDSRRSPKVYFHRGVAFEKAGKPEQAIDDYTRAIALFPSYYEAFFSRGTAYDRMGRFDQAIEDYTSAIFLKPSSYEAYTNRGLAYKKIGRRVEAIADFNRAISLSASAGKAYLNIGITRFEDGMYTEAIEQFDRAIAIDPMDTEAYGNRGLAHAVTGQTSAALKDFDKAIELRPDFPDIYYNRGRLYAASGRWEPASRDYQKACQLGDEISCQALRELSSH
jgi:protein O-mannosyl-transferase